jgi:hypothetical protein
MDHPLARRDLLGDRLAAGANLGGDRLDDPQELLSGETLVLVQAVHVAAGGRAQRLAGELVRPQLPDVPDAPGFDPVRAAGRKPVRAQRQDRRQRSRRAHRDSPPTGTP